MLFNVIVQLFTCSSPWCCWPSQKSSPFALWLDLSSRTGQFRQPAIQRVSGLPESSAGTKSHPQTGMWMPNGCHQKSPHFSWKEEQEIRSGTHDTGTVFLFLLYWEQLNKQKSINAMNMAINFRLFRGIFPDLPIPMQIAISWLPNLLRLLLTNCSFNWSLLRLPISDWGATGFRLFYLRGQPYECWKTPNRGSLWSL